MRRALPPLLALVLALVLLTGCEFSLERLAHGGALPPPPEDYTGLQDGFRYTKTTLTGQERYLYDQLLAGLQNQEETIGDLYPDTEMIQTAIDAIDRDYPELFWFSGTGQIETTLLAGKPLEAAYTPVYTMDQAQRQATQAQIEQEKAELEEARTAQEEARQKQADAKARLKSQQAEVDALISQISSQEDELEAMEAKLQAAAKAMDNEIARKERELQAQLAAQGVTIVSEKGFKWPSYATTITSLFGSRTHPVTGRPNNHTGVDIAAAGGTDIWAAKSGVVLTSTYNSSYGNYVVISHANGESTLYAHMSKRLVSEGDKVTQGQTIGLVGTTGSSTGNHLHFEVRLNGQRQDPLNYFRGSTFTLRASGKSVSYTVS